MEGKSLRLRQSASPFSLSGIKNWLRRSNLPRKSRRSQSAVPVAVESRASVGLRTARRAPCASASAKNRMPHLSPWHAQVAAIYSYPCHRHPSRAVRAPSGCFAGCQRDIANPAELFPHLHTGSPGDRLDSGDPQPRQPPANGAEFRETRRCRLGFEGTPA